MKFLIAFIITYSFIVWGYPWMKKVICRYIQRKKTKEINNKKQ
jgi:hypothetical protein